MSRVNLWRRWDGLRTSFWFVPSVLLILAFALALLTLHLDRTWADEPSLAWMYEGGADGARLVLSTVAGSVMTVAGVVFSVTTVTLTLASSQFGPRLIRNFMRDTGTQVVLGTFTATFLYCVVVLREVRGESSGEFVPGVSVTVAVVLAVVDLVVLIFFIHHLARSIQVGEVLRRVAAELEDGIEELYPQGVGEPPEPPRPPPVPPPQRAVLAAPQDGYLQTVDDAWLMRVATELKVVVRLCRRPGDFVVQGEPLAEVWPVDRADKEACERLQRAWTLGHRRTPVQDVAYLFDELVQVALRALSTGIDDPSTAVSAIERLGAGLVRVARRARPATCRVAEDGRVRVLAEPLSLPTLIEQTVGELRRHGSDERRVVLGLLGVLERLGPHLGEEDRLFVAEEAHRVARAGLAAHEDLHDRAGIERALRRALREVRHPPTQHELPYEAALARYWGGSTGASQPAGGA